MLHMAVTVTLQRETAVTQRKTYSVIQFSQAGMKREISVQAEQTGGDKNKRLHKQQVVKHAQSITSAYLRSISDSSDVPAY